MLRKNLTLKEHLQHATYAYIAEAKSNPLTEWYKAKGVARAEKYLQDNENATDEDILADLRNPKGSLASSLDYKARITLAVLAHKNECSVDVLTYAITKCAQDRQAIVTRMDHNCTLVDIHTLKGELIAGCINGSQRDEAALAKKVASILNITALAGDLNRSYRDVCEALMACVSERKKINPDAGMSTFLEECYAKNKETLEELSVELNKDKQSLEMQSVSSSPRP